MRSSYLAGILFAVLCVGKGALLAQDRPNPGNPPEAANLAAQYAETIAALDAKIGESPEEILENAREVAREFASQVHRFDKQPRQNQQEMGDAVRAGARWVNKTDLLPLVQDLGDVAARLTDARRWTDWTLRDERLNLAAARREVKARNIAEIQRAYADVQAAIWARRMAAYQFWALARGRAKVVVHESMASMSRTRDATQGETRDYAAGLYSAATAPVNVARPRKTRLKDVYSIDRLVELGDREAHLDRLGNLVDAQLKHIASAHTDQVEQAFRNGMEQEKIAAVLTLGWWNGGEGREIINACLLSESRELREAGIGALLRLRHDEHSLMQLAKHNQLDVRRLAIQLALEQVHDLPTAHRVLQKLLADADADVRREAYAAFDRVLTLQHLNPFDRVRAIMPLLRDGTNSAVVVDAIRWLEWFDDEGNLSVRGAKRSLLGPLSRHQNEEIRTAASQALN